MTLAKAWRYLRLRAAVLEAGEEYCGAPDPRGSVGERCTRPAGHDPPHACHGEDPDRPLWAWRDEEGEGEMTDPTYRDFPASVDAAILRLCAALREDEFTGSVEVDGEWWDVYVHRDGRRLVTVAVRLTDETPPSAVVGLFRRGALTLAEATRLLQGDT